MLPLPGPSKPGSRKSPFLDSSTDNKRRRMSNSPMRPSSASDVLMNPREPVFNRFHGSPGVSLGRHLPLPAIDLAYQPSGPDQDANKLLGCTPHPTGHMQWPAQPANPLLSHQSIWRHDEGRDGIREPVQQRETPTPSPIIKRCFNHGQQPTSPNSDAFRTPQTALPFRPHPYGWYQHPTPPQTDPLQTPLSVLPRAFPQSAEPQQATPPRSDPPKPPQTKLPFRPRQFKIPQKELAVQLVEFEELAAHTAKCDVCDKRNTDGMVRCKPCGWQCCRRCLAERSGDRTHPKAGNLHVPDDVAHAQRHTTRNPVTPSSNRQRPIASERVAMSYATPEEEAAMILLNLKNGNKNTGGLTRGSGQIAGPSSQTPGRTVDDGLEFDSDETEILPDINTDDETDEDDNLPEKLVNVRRNPSRRARPADMKE